MPASIPTQTIIVFWTVTPCGLEDEGNLNHKIWHQIPQNYLDTSMRIYLFSPLSPFNAPQFIDVARFVQ
jgi:hypothetical protein